MSSRRWVWCDLENTPHVLFLYPIIAELRKLGHDVRVTAKPQGQTIALARARGVEATPVGSGDFKRFHQKVLGNLGRAWALARWIGAQGRPALFISSSRSGSFAAWCLRIPARSMLDYEHAEQRTLQRADRMWLPDVLVDAELQPTTRQRAAFYPGLKENLYLDAWEPNRSEIRQRMGFEPDSYLVVARPAAEAAHYATDQSSRMWMKVVRGLAERPEIRIIVMPRDDDQRAAMTERLAGIPRTEVLQGVVDGPELVAAADLVIGAGGTMNREAAVLGTPVWSTFCGPPPHIDEKLAGEGRLRWVRADQEADDALSIPLPGRNEPRGPFPQGLEEIVQDLDSVLSRTPSH